MAIFCKQELTPTQGTPNEYLHMHYLPQEMYLNIVHVTTVTLSLKNLPKRSDQAPLEMADSPHQVPGQYIVVLDANVTDEQG